jgi:drug/metabolite transporter (DMT)-like permease
MQIEHKATPIRAFPWVAIGALLLVNALWGISFPVVKVLNAMSDAHFGIAEATESNTFRLLTSTWMLATRFSLAFVFLVVFCFRVVYDTTRREWLAGACIGVLFFAGIVLQVIGLASIPASRSGFLTSLTTVFTPILAVLLFRTIPSRWMVIGAILALAGVMILTELIVFEGGGVGLAGDASSRWTLGDSLTTIGSMFFAFQVLLLDYFGRRMRSLALTSGMFLVTAILSWVVTAVVLNTSLRAWTGVPAMGVTDWWQLSLQGTYIVSLVVLASLCSLVSFGLMNRYQPHVSASQAAVIYSMEPVAASTWALFLPGWLSIATGMLHPNEEVTWSLLAGGLMILIANVVALFPSPSNHDTAE